MKLKVFQDQYLHIAKWSIVSRDVRFMKLIPQYIFFHNFFYKMGLDKL